MWRCTIGREILANLAAHHPLDQWPLIANVMSCVQYVTKARTIQSPSMLSEIPGSYRSDCEGHGVVQCNVVYRSTWLHSITLQEKLVFDFRLRLGRVVLVYFNRYFRFVLFNSTILQDLICHCMVIIINYHHFTTFPYTNIILFILWNNQQMQLYAVNFIPLLGSLYMFWVFYTPIIRSTIFNCIYSHWYKP